MIEEGIREVLLDGLSGKFRVRKRKVKLAGSKLTLNPDLVFDDELAVADVKYKLVGTEWRRPDLYQVVTFAEGLGTRDAAIVDFGNSILSPEKVVVGSKEVRHLPWRLNETPDEARTRFVSSVFEWLNGRSDRVGKGT